MGREQSEKLNTSPSRGSGYQVINDLFDRQQDFIVVGLCGKTGSGVSTTAEILNKEFEELHLNAEPPAAGTTMSGMNTVCCTTMLGGTGTAFIWSRPAL